MAFNGSGVFNRIHNWVTDKGNLVKITASRQDTEDDGFATGLSNTICRDGQSTTTAAIPFAAGVKLSDGLVGTPSLTFTTDTDTGLYAVGANELGLTVGGAKTWGFGTATASAAGSLVVGGTLRVVGAGDACRVYKDSDTAITYNTVTTISFNAEDHDAQAMHSSASNASRITITRPGVYLFHWSAYGAAEAAKAQVIWRGYIWKNGNTYVGRSQVTLPATLGDLIVADVAQIDVTAIVAAETNDYFEARVYQANTNEGALNLIYEAGMSPYFSAARIL
jgi:hypothetical protein